MHFSAPFFSFTLLTTTQTIDQKFKLRQSDWRGNILAFERLRVGVGRRKNLLACLFVFDSFVCFHRYLVNGRKHEPVDINSLGELSNTKSRSTMESMDVSDKFKKNCVPRNSRLIIYLKKKYRVENSTIKQFKNLDGLFRLEDSCFGWLTTQS